MIRFGSWDYDSAAFRNRAEKCKRLAMAWKCRSIYNAGIVFMYYISEQPSSLHSDVLLVPTILSVFIAMTRPWSGSDVAPKPLHGSSDSRSRPFRSRVRLTFYHSASTAPDAISLRGIFLLPSMRCVVCPARSLN